MRVSETALSGVKLLSPERHSGARGWFAEFFNAGLLQRTVRPRSLHRTTSPSQPAACCVRCTTSFGSRGESWSGFYPERSGTWPSISDVARPQFGRWTAVPLRPLDVEGCPEMLWIREGFAHGFLVLSGTAEVLYKVSRPYDPGGERTLLWNDPKLNIAWPLDRLDGESLRVSAKDKAGLPLASAELP